MAGNLPCVERHASLAAVGRETLVRRAVLVASLALALAACRRQKGPDENFHAARELYQQLYAAQLDDAYGDPRMDEVVALLQKVDPRSVDAPQAQAMLGAIAHGKEQLATERAAREKLANETVKAIAPPAGIDPDRILAALQRDAGPPRDPYGRGADLAALNSQNGGCLAENESFTEQGTRVAGSIYRLGESDECRRRLPGFVGQAVLVVGGKIYRRIPDPVTPQGTTQPDTGAVPAGSHGASQPSAPAGAQPTTSQMYPEYPDAG